MIENISGQSVANLHMARLCLMCLERKKVYPGRRTRGGEGWILVASLVLAFVIMALFPGKKTKNLS